MSRKRVCSEQVIREFVREQLNEYGDYAGVGYYDDSPGGTKIVDTDKMYKTFVEPFVNVGKMAIGKTKELSRSAQTLASVALMQTVSTLLPFYKARYDKVFEAERKDIARIKSELGDVYNAIWGSFEMPDIVVAAFMYRPDLLLTAKFAEHAPNVAIRMASVLSGGKLDNVLPEPRKRKSEPFLSGPGLPESVIREALELSFEQIFANKKVREILANSDITKKISNIGKNLLSNTLNNIFKQAKDALAVNSVNDIVQQTKKQTDEIKKLDKLQGEERQKAERAIIDAFKKSIKEFYVKQLTNRAKLAVKYGVPETHPYVKAYIALSEKIKAL